MRITRLLFSVLFAVFVSSAFSQVTFNQYYPFGKETRPTDIIVNKDSTFTLFGQFTPTGSVTTGLFLTKIDKNGNVLLQKNYLSNTTHGFLGHYKNKVYSPVNDHTFLILGSFYNSSVKVGFLVASINAQTLDTNWVKYYSDTLYNLPSQHIIKLHNNRFWLIANKFNNNDPNYLQRPVILQTDTLGNITFVKEISNLLNYSTNDALYDSIPGHIYFTGSDHTIPTSPQTHITCIDTSGAIIWNTHIGIHPNVTEVFGIEKRNNYLIVCGGKWVYKISGFNMYKFSLIKVNCAAGNVTWQKIYGSEGPVNILRALTIDTDESITAVSNKQYFWWSNSCDGFTMKVDNNGTGMWMKSFSNYTASIYGEPLGDVHSTLDKGYIICGTPGLQNTHAWVIKMDSLGNAPGAITTTLTAEDVSVITNINHPQSFNSEIQIFPNPANHLLQVDLTNENIATFREIRIYNNLGQLTKVISVGTEEKQLSIRTDDLPEGLYVLQLTVTTGQILAKRFVISR